MFQIRSFRLDQCCEIQPSPNLLFWEVDSKNNLSKRYLGVLQKRENEEEVRWWSKVDQSIAGEPPFA